MKTVNGKEVKFARVGGLSAVRQKGYDVNMDYLHSPPCRKGIYAFVYPYYEPFLLSGEDYSGIKTKNSKFEFIKDRNGTPIEVQYDETYEHKGTENWMKFWGLHWIEDGKPFRILKPKKPKVFKHTGELWHHLGHHLKLSEILSTKGEWILSDFNSYVRALNKEFSSRKARLKASSDLETNNPFGYVNIDNLEVFIEKVK